MQVFVDLNLDSALQPWFLKTRGFFGGVNCSSFCIQQYYVLLTYLSGHVNTSSSIIRALMMARSVFA